MNRIFITIIIMVISLVAKAQQFKFPVPVPANLEERRIWENYRMIFQEGVSEYSLDSLLSIFDKVVEKYGNNKPVELIHYSRKKGENIIYIGKNIELFKTFIWTLEMPGKEPYYSKHPYSFIRFYKKSKHLFVKIVEYEEFPGEIIEGRKIEKYNCSLVLGILFGYNKQTKNFHYKPIPYKGL